MTYPFFLARYTEANSATFHAYMDRLATVPVVAHGALAKVEDGDRFAEVLKQVQKLKQERRNQQ